MSLLLAAIAASSQRAGTQFKLQTHERGPDGIEISHLYDAAGRARSERRTFTDASDQCRTLATRYEYDDKGLLTATIGHANRTTRTEYKVSAQVEALGRRTEMVYDARGNHAETHLLDGTSGITVYVEEGGGDVNRHASSA